MSANNSGGDLFDMAKDGTKIPEDSAKPNYIPSKARPEQTGEATADGRGSSQLHMAADNALSTTGFGEAVSANGGELPANIDQKYSMSGGKDRGSAPNSHDGRNH